MRSTWRELTVAVKGVVAAGVLAGWALGAQAAVELEGVKVDEAVTASGTHLVLNGAAVRKRGFFKTDVTALYLPEKSTSPDAVYHPRGPLRIVLYLLRDIPTSLASRFFVSDFKQVATDAEFRQLINEVGRTGALYGNLNRIAKGDVVVMDYVPGKGMTINFNGKPLTDTPWRNDLYVEVYLRMFVGSTVPDDFRKGLLGLTPLPRATTP
jgi:hypothetical protein